MIRSTDGRRTWSQRYSSTVELADGTLLSVWYERLTDDPMAVLRQARWRIGD
jgi:hypothetical protein